MPNDYYNPTGWPATGAPGHSAPARSELGDIRDGFAKLPTLTGNGNKAVVVNAGGTALSVTVGALALAAAFTLSGAFATTLTVTALTNVTLPTTGTLATLAGTESLSNKTLVAPALGTPVSGVLTNCTGYVGTSTLVTTGALNSGSITSGFGSIDVGADSITGGAGSFTTLAASGNVSLGDATGDAHTVTGTLAMTVSGNNGLSVANGTNTTYLGSTGGNAVVGTISAHNLYLVRNAIAIAEVSATGFAVTGTLGVSGRATISDTGTGAGELQVGGTIPTLGMLASYDQSGNTTLTINNQYAGHVGSKIQFGFGTVGSNVWMYATKDLAVVMPGSLNITGTMASAGGWMGGTQTLSSLISQASSGGGTTTHYIGNQSITTSSDERIKNILGPTKRDALAIFNALEVFDHTWNDPTDTSRNNRNARGVWTGISAQQSDKHVPWLVNRPRFEGDDDFTWTMDLAYMAPLFVKGFQQVGVKVDDHESQIQSLLAWKGKAESALSQHGITIQ